MNNTVGGKLSQNINALFNDDTQSTKRSGDVRTGMGLRGPGGAVPDAVHQHEHGHGSGAALRASLSAFMSVGKLVDTAVLLIQVAVAMRDTEATSQKTKINTDQETKKAQSKDREADLEKAQKKMEEAESKKRSGNIFDKIKLAFEWLGAALAVAAAVVLIATGVGAAVGAALMVAAVVAITMAIDSSVAMATGKGIAGNLHYLVATELQGKSPEVAEKEASKADMGFRISMAVIGIAAAIASGGATMGGSVKGAVQAGAAVAQTAEKVANETLRMVGTAVKLASLIQQIGTAGIEAGSTALKYETTTATADARKLEASAKTKEAMMQVLDDMIDQALSRLVASSQRFAAIVDLITDAAQDSGHSLSRARF